PVALHQLMRIGADDFLPYPLPSGGLHDVIARLRKSKQSPDPDASSTSNGSATPPPHFHAKGDRHGILLPVHGMAGGTGASTFATNLAWELVDQGKSDPPRVCLLDLDFQYGSIATYLDLPRKDAVFDLLTDPQAADATALLNAMQSFNERLFVLTAPADMLP